MSSETQDVCASCGRKARLVDGLCSECYIKRHDLFLVEPSYEIERCVRCGKVRIGFRWVDPDEEIFERFLISQAKKAHVLKSMDIRPEIVDVGDYDILYTLNFIGTTYDDVVIEDSRMVNIHLRRSVCTSCSRMAGEYYEAIIQIRGEDRIDRKEIEGILEDIYLWAGPRIEKGNFFISKVEYVRGGVDLRVSSTSGGNEIASYLTSKYGGEVKKSFSQGGFRDGKPVYRQTILVRLPSLRKGDILSVGDRIYAIARISGRHIYLYDLLSHRVHREEVGIIKKGRGYRRNDVVSKALVVYTEGRDLHVLHPSTMETVTISKPENYSGEIEAGREIEVVNIDEKLYLYPEIQVT